MSLRLIASLSLLAAIVFCALSSPRAADEAKPAQPGHLVAILDYEEVFQKSLRYKSALDKLRTDNLKVESDFKTRNETLHKLEEDLKALQPGSPDFNKRQEEATLLKHDGLLRKI
jgi:Skp family chaperone for outer membrane proteins